MKTALSSLCGQCQSTALFPWVSLKKSLLKVTLERVDHRRTLTKLSCRKRVGEIRVSVSFLVIAREPGKGLSA